MRLLKSDLSGWQTNSYTSCFVDHDFRTTQHPYAILSHRWGDDEITYQDILTGTAKSKAESYKKLEFCANQAMRDGLRYFWVDTCCIDKPNHTEFSAAINSMYKWYNRAAKCYVYLRDISVESQWRLSFQYSEWFYRGWTLQELIAPVIVEFFSIEGVKLGDKKSLELQISQATRISVEVLRGRPLAEVSVNERFSWADHRITKEEEDAAYCLLGIFDVNMPLIYGEEREKAMIRLKEEISKKSQPHLAEREIECLQAFKTSRYERHKAAIQTHAEGTCRWVLNHSSYKQWYESSHNDLLWISADPGCGKSVLSKFLIDHELQTSSRRTTCYYFFKDNGQQGQLASALCAVLHQLFSDQPHLLIYAMQDWEANGSQIKDELRVLWQILIRAASDKAAKPIVCILDALDECCDKDRGYLIKQLCDFHKGSSERPQHAGLKFLLTSRPYHIIQDGFQDIVSKMPRARLYGEAENDCIRQEIDQVIEQHVASLASDFNLSGSSQLRLRQQLHAMQHRTYLWLFLAIDEIRNRYRNSLDPNHEIIDELPVSVEDAYERILQRIAVQHKSRARRILSIIVGARRPLTIGEANLAVNAAVAYEDGELTVKQPNLAHFEEYVKEWCGLFIFINHSQLFLIHQTAKEFLLTTSPLLGYTPQLRLWKASLSKPCVERELAIMCITFLRLLENAPPVSDTDVVRAKAEFLDYSAQYWTSHLSDDDIKKHPVLLNNVLDLYDTNNGRFNVWFNNFWKNTYPSRNVPEMKDHHAISIFGHAQVLTERYKREQFDPNDREISSGATTLELAAEAGNLDAVRWLLCHGADANINGKYGTALQTATFHGHLQVVQTLLKSGAYVNTDLGYYGTALDAAIMINRDDIAEILLSYGAIGSPDETIGNGLIEASKHGQTKIVRTILDKRLKVITTGIYLNKALVVAAISGHTQIVQLLLDAGGEVGARKVDLDNAISAALNVGHQNIVRILFEFSDRQQ